MPDTSTGPTVSETIPFLLQPLGWIYDRIHRSIDEDQSLAKSLLAIEPTRIHVAGLVLAHFDGDCTGQFTRFLLTDREKAIITNTLGNYPAGLHRALRQLPAHVLAAEIYRNLIDLLADTVIAKLLRHSTSITDREITGLHRLPKALRRPAVMPIVDACPGMDRFVDGLQVLASRAGLPFENVVGQIALLNQPQQVVAKIRQIADSLPLDITLPPAKVGNFRRLDCAVEIRRLAKQWRNCLANYVSNVNDGTAAIYLSETDQAVCFLCRYGRLGWLIDDAKGPRNTPINGPLMQQIYRDFSNAGIFETSTLVAIQQIMVTNKWRRPQTDDDDNLAEIHF